MYPTSAETGEKQKGHLWDKTRIPDWPDRHGLSVHLQDVDKPVLVFYCAERRPFTITAIIRVPVYNAEFCIYLG
jgi:hypothetical protein